MTAAAWTVTPKRLCAQPLKAHFVELCEGQPALLALAAAQWVRLRPLHSASFVLGLVDARPESWTCSRLACASGPRLGGQQGTLPQVLAQRVDQVGASVGGAACGASTLRGPRPRAAATGPSSASCGLLVRRWRGRSATCSRRCACSRLARR